MPRIPDSTQLGYSVPRTRTPRFQDRSGEIVADATQGFARTLGQVADSLQEHDDQFNYARAKSTLLAADVEARRELENDPDWESYEKRYTERMAKAREQATGLIRGGRSRSLFDMDAKLDVERGTGEVRNIARRKEVDWGRSSLEASLAANRSAALSASDEATRTSLLSASQDLIAGAVSKGYTSAEEGGTLGRQFAENYAGGYIDTQPYAKQVEILKNPDNTPARFLQPDQRANLLRQAENQLRIERDRAEAEQRAKLVEVRQSLNDQLRDISAAAQMGLPVSVPSRDLLRTAFGEREGEQKYQLAVKASKLSGDVSSLHQLPTEEVLRRVDSYMPSQAEGAADQAQLYGHMANSARSILKQRDDDPAGYLVQYAPATQSAWNAFQSTGTEAARDAYLAAVDADRERLGLPKGDILPNSYAQALTEEISNPKAAEDLASLVESEATKWGDRWPDVHAQVAKGLPDIAAVIGSGIDRSAAVALASTAKLKDTDLQKMLPPSVKWGDVQADVASTFDDVRRAFPAEGARTWQAIQDSATRLAVSYMQAGDSKSNAIDRAYKELIGKQYGIGEVRDVPFLVPLNYDAGDIEDEAAKVLSEFEPTADMIVAPVGDDPSRFLERAKETFRDSAYFVQSGDGSGLTLYLNARPTGIKYSFEDLANRSAQRRADEQAAVVRQREKAMKSRAAGGR